MSQLPERSGAGADSTACQGCIRDPGSCSARVRSLHSNPCKQPTHRWQVVASLWHRELIKSEANGDSLQMRPVHAMSTPASSERRGPEIGRQDAAVF